MCDVLSLNGVVQFDIYFSFTEHLEYPINDLMTLELVLLIAIRYSKTLTLERDPLMAEYSE